MDTVSRKAILEWANDQPTTNAPYYLAYAQCKIDFLKDFEEGRFDSTESEGEADIRKIEEKIELLLNDDSGGSWNKNHDSDYYSKLKLAKYELLEEDIPRLISQYKKLTAKALEGSTSETAVQPDIEAIVNACGNLERYDYEDHNSPECVDDLDPDAQAEIDEWVSGLLRESARNAIYTYLDEQGIIPVIGDREPETAAQLEAAISAIEDEMCDDFSPRAQQINKQTEILRKLLGITMPGIKDGREGTDE